MRLASRPKLKVPMALDKVQKLHPKGVETAAHSEGLPFAAAEAVQFTLGNGNMVPNLQCRKK